MEKKYEELEKAIKRKHVFGFSPKYKESFSVKLKPKVVCAIGEIVFKELDWKIIYMDECEVKGFIIDEYDRIAYKFDIQVNESGKIDVQCFSEKNEFWDKGRNSKKVKLFIHVFNDKLKEYTIVKLKSLEDEIRKRENWDDYEIPESLPQPPKYKKPNITMPVLGGMLCSLLLAYIISFLAYKGAYIVGLFEIGVGMTLGLCITISMKLGNFLYWNYIRIVLLGSVLLTFILSNVFLYQFSVISGETYAAFSDFMAQKFNKGIALRRIEFGSWAVIVHWGIQIFFTYFIASIKLTSSCFSITMSRVPVEVVEFAMYHTVKGKDHKEIEKELAKIGWENKIEQQMVFEALGTSMRMHQQFKTI